MRKYEYHQAMIEPGDKIAEQMNKLGAEGWEFCFTLQLMMQSPLSPGPPQPKLLVVFKRELSTILAE